MNEKMKWILFFLVIAIVLIALNKLMKGGLGKAFHDVGGVASDATGAVKDVADVAKGATGKLDYLLGSLTETEIGAKLKALPQWNDSFLKGYKGYVPSSDSLQKLLEEIKNAGGLFRYGDSSILAAFRALTSQGSITKLAILYRVETGKSLMNDVYSAMSNDAIKELYKIIVTLPK